MTDMEQRFYIKHIALSLRGIFHLLNYTAQGVTKNKAVEKYKNENWEEEKEEFEEQLDAILVAQGEE